MPGEFKAGDFVVCKTDNGYIVENGRPASIKTHFHRNSVCRVEEIGDSASKVHVIGENADYLLDNSCLHPIDPKKTGKGFGKKICNICHVLKEHSAFEPNQTDASGNITTRPSCRVCRRNIDRIPAAPAAKKAAEKRRPKKGTLWQCPICRKRSIVGVTAKVVLDHNHSDGAPRDFLCDSCNTGLGRFKNGGNFLKNAIAYLDRFEK